MTRQKMIYLLLLIIACSLSGCMSPAKNPTNPKEHLNRAAERGDVAMVERLLAEGVEPSGWEIRGAEAKGHHEIVKMIIDRCLEIYVPGRTCNSLPFGLAEKGDPATLATLLAKGADPNQQDRNGASLLTYAVAARNDANAKVLVSRGADIDQSVQSFKTSLARLTELQTVGDPKLDLKASDFHLEPQIAEAKANIAFLNTMRQEARVDPAAEDPSEEARFLEVAKEYRSATIKPTLPEEARRFKVQAEEMVREKKFEVAAKLYNKALGIAPWWPEGHFNRALVLAESRYYQGAMREMKRYLALVPNAPDARAAQDKIYAWEIKTMK